MGMELEGHDLFESQVVAALLSFIGSVLIIVAFAITPDSQTKQAKCCKGCGKFAKLFNFTGIFERPCRPIYSTLVLFLAISIVIRSVANLFAGIGYVQPNDMLCRFEAIFRTYSAVSTLLTQTLLALQFYAETLSIKANGGSVATLYIDDFIRDKLPYLFHLSIRREKIGKFTTLLYHIVFMWPLVLALLPLLSDDYGVHTNGLQRCTFRPSTGGLVWSMCVLYVWVLFCWIVAGGLYFVISVRGERVFKGDGLVLFRLVSMYVVVSVLCWLPLFIATVSKQGGIAKAWEVVIQLEGFLYFLLYTFVLCVGEKSTLPDDEEEQRPDSLFELSRNIIDGTVARSSMHRPHGARKERSRSTNSDEGDGAASLAATDIAI